MAKSEGVEASISALKAAADRHWRFDEHLPALQAYIASVRVPELARLVEAAMVALAKPSPVATAIMQLVRPPAADVGEAFVTGEALTMGLLPSVLATYQELVDAFDRKGIPSIAGNAASNLSMCCMHFRLWPQAAVAALAAPLLNPQLLDKSLGRLAVACAHLGVDLEPAVVQLSKEAVAMVAPTLATIRQERAGVFDFARLAKGGSDTQPQADYRTEFDLRDAGPGKGLGLFAKTPLRRGSVVLCEHAVAWATRSELEAGVDGALRQLEAFAQLPSAGFLMGRVVSVYDGENRGGDATPDPRWVAAQLHGLSATTGEATLCTFEVVVPSQSTAHFQGAMALNAYTGEHYVARSCSDDAGVGLYPTAALFNHSEEPNVVHRTYGKALVVTMSRDVEAGEELCTTYAPPSAYLHEEAPLQRYGIPGFPDANSTAVRKLYESLGASKEKLLAFQEAGPLLDRVTRPLRNAFIVDAGLFAAMAGEAGEHPALVRLFQLLQDPDLVSLPLLEHCATIVKKCKKRMKRPVANAVEQALKPWCAIALGHQDLDVLVRS